MGFDQTYDEMLHNEFGSSGGHAFAGIAPVSSEAFGGPSVSEVSAGPSSGSPFVRAPQHVLSSTALHRAFRAGGIHAAEDVPSHGEGPRGFSRYRNAAMVGAGGLTCAAIGAFLGGLGGYFTVNPAAAHPLASAAGPSQQLASAVDQAYRVASGGGSADATTVSFSSPSGALAQGVDPLQWLTTTGSDNVSVLGSPATATSQPGLGAVGSGSGSGGLGLGLGCTSESDLGVGCILGSVTSVLGSLGSASSDPSSVVDELLPSLSGVVSDVTGTLSDLGALMPIGSLPTAGLPTAVLEELGLGSLLGSGTGSGGLASLSSLGGPPGALGSIGSGGADSLPGSTSGPGSVLSGMLGAAGAASSTTGPLSSASGSSSGLHATAPSGRVSSSASTGGSTTTTSTSTTTTTTKPSGSGSSGTTVTVPLPALPLPSTPPVSVGGVSVGATSSSSGSGLSLTLP
jgi:hypothetical protein